MLELAQSLSNSEGDYNKVCNAILEHCRTLCSADRASLFLVNREKDELEAHFMTGEVIKMSMSCGIAGHVATTGETVNILDAYRDPNFNQVAWAMEGMGGRPGDLWAPAYCRFVVISPGGATISGGNNFTGNFSLVRKVANSYPHPPPPLDPWGG